MIVDVHTHRWQTPDQLGAAGAERLRSFGEGPWDRLDAGGDAHEKASEAVDYAIVHGFVSTYLDAYIDAEAVAGYVQRNPAKFIGFAGIDPMADDYLEEFDRAVELGLAGVTISPAAQGFHPTHTRAITLYDRCQQNGMPVFIHPDTHLGPTTMLEFAQPYLFDEVARDFPGLPLVFAQVGHPWADQTLTLIGKHPNVYADLSDLIRRPWQLYNVLLLAYQQNVCEHLLLGSDFPFRSAEKAIVTIYSVNSLTHGTNLPTVPREQLRLIVERDALACLGLKPPAGGEVAPARTDTVEPAAKPADEGENEAATPQADDPPAEPATPATTITVAPATETTPTDEADDPPPVESEPDTPADSSAPSERDDPPPTEQADDAPADSDAADDDENEDEDEDEIAAGAADTEPTDDDQAPPVESTTKTQGARAGE